MTEEPKHASEKVKLLSGGQLRNLNIPDIEWLVGNLIPKASLVFVYGCPASFKSSFCNYIVMKLADGQRVFDFEVKHKARTLWIDEENRDRGTKNKYIKISNGIEFVHKDWEEHILFSISNRYEIVDLQWTKWMIDTIKMNNINIVVIDSLSMTFFNDERDEKQVKLIHKHLDKIIRETGVTIVAIAHCRKLNHNQFKRGMEDLSGSREFGAMCDSMLLLEEISHGKYRVTQTKNRHNEKSDTFVFDVSNNANQINITYGGKTKEYAKKKFEEFAEKLQTWIDTANKKTIITEEAEQFAKESSVSRDCLYKALNYLVEQNKLAHIVKGCYHVIIQ